MSDVSPPPGPTSPGSAQNIPSPDPNAPPPTPSGVPADPLSPAPDPNQVPTLATSLDDQSNLEGQQRQGRPEWQDFLRVLSQFGGVPMGGDIGLLKVARDYNIYLNFTGAGTQAGAVTPQPGSSAPGAPTAEVSAEDIRKIRQVYQIHAGYNRALGFLSDTRSVLLRGSVNVG